MMYPRKFFTYHQPLRRGYLPAPRPGNRAGSAVVFGRDVCGRGASVWRGAAILLVLFALTGCERRPPSGSGRFAAPVTSSQRSPIETAMDYLSRLEDFEPQQGMMQVAYQLNRWLESVDDFEQWEPSPLLDDLPPTLRAIAPLARLEKREITLDDVLYLREASWMKSVSQWVADHEDMLDVSSWLEQLEPSLGEPHAHDVALAMRLFDWTVQNIQLDALPDFPVSEETPPGFDPVFWPLYRAQAGPGYRTWPWQTLLFGRGDAWQRARVFAGLARQQEIDVVMLAIQDEGHAGRPRPWLTAALIDDRLYLFDPQLGLPIAGLETGSVATLQQVRQDPSLLRRLDLGKDLVYPVRADDLTRLVVLLDAPPESFSYRMHRIESQPTSSPPLALTIEPQRLISRLADCGLQQVQIWHTPLETWIFRNALKRYGEEDAELIQYLLFEEWIFDNEMPLVRARQLHLRGRFEQEEERNGAKAEYLRARVPNTKIARITTSPEVRKELGIVRGRQNDLQWEVYLQSSESILVRAKQNASLWLGLIHYATGRHEDARDWFQIRCLDAYEDGPWTGSARYNLARSYERMNDLEAARQLYLLDDSPQKHGNLIRARMLRQRLEKK
jgi:tetratricopeptide (TPR) repeat protein